MTTGREMTSLLKFLFFFCAAGLTPLIRPALPGNTAIFDYVAAAFMFIFWIGLLLGGQIKTRLGAPMALIFLASLIAMLNSAALPMNLLTLAQEAYLFLFFLTLYNLLETQQDFKTLVHSWIFFAGVQGAVMANEILHDSGVRAQGTFDNPNMAGSYLGLSVFLVFQPFTRLGWYVKGLYLFLLLFGVFATKSLSAMLAVVVALGITSVLYWVRARGGNRGVLVVAALSAVIVVAAVSPWWLDTHNFLDRLPKSTDERTVIWQTGIETFLRNPLGTGIGPGGFGVAGFVSGGYWGVGRRISLHSDYLSFLVERGVLGFTGLLLLLVALALGLRRCLRAVKSDRELLWVASLAGMLVFILVDAVSHEVMHYRHVWLAFGLMTAYGLLAGKVHLEPVSGRQPARRVVLGARPRVLPTVLPPLGR